MAEVTQTQPAQQQPQAAPAFDPDIQRRKKDYKAWLDATQKAREEANIDRDYYDHKQLTRGEKKVLAERGQPDNVFNRIQPEVNGTVGVIEKGRVDPRAYPRNPQQEDASEVATDALRYVADYTRLNPKRSRLFENACIEGICAALVEIDEDKEVCLQRIRFEEFFFDPRSREIDFSDARFMGMAKWTDKDDLKTRYKDKAQQIDSAMEGGMSMTDSGTQDRPFSFIDRTLQRVLLIEEYYKFQNGWARCIFAGDIVFEAGPSPYPDARGRPSNPIEAYSAYVDRDNARYGIVRAMRGPQDEINKRRSKLLHLLTMRQAKIKPGAVDDEDELRRQLARPDGLIRENITDGIVILDTIAQATGQAELLAEAKAEIERMGPNPAVLGRNSEDASGRALLARQQAGLVELALLFGGFEDFTLRLYRQFWARIRGFWDQQKWVRVTDDANAPKYIQINVPVIDPNTGQPAVDPQTGQPVLQNAPAQMDMDIIVDSTPDTATIQQDQFDGLMKIITAIPQLAPTFMKPLIMASALPNKRELLDAMDKAQQASQQPPQMTPEQQADIDNKKADTGLKKANTFKALADAHAGALETEFTLNQPPPMQQEMPQQQAPDQIQQPQPPLQ